MAIAKGDRWVVFVNGDEVGSFKRLPDANKALTREIRIWRSSGYRRTALLQKQVYDYFRRPYILKSNGKNVGWAHIMDTKPLPTVFDDA